MITVSDGIWLLYLSNLRLVVILILWFTATHVGILTSSFSSESEWENPFAAKHGGNQDNNENKSYESCFHLNEDDDELPYPKFVRQVERILASEAAYPTNDEASSSGIYNPPRDSMMGPPVYPPATGNYQQFNEAQFQPKSSHDVKEMIMLNSQSWSDNKSKLLYVENLLGEQEKLMWQQWRTAYPEAYETITGMAEDS
ncbi:hypothetical protein Tco_1039108 [Tanacetum coccineum]